jgi:putative oxidoreductase
MNEDIGKLVLRLALGGMILTHGVDKLTTGIDAIVDIVTGAGMPGFVAYGIYIGEVVAPVLLITGWNARIGAALIAVNMLFAIGLVHAADILSLNPNGGWVLDSQGMFLLTAVALALLGPGRFRIPHVGGRARRYPPISA